MLKQQTNLQVLVCCDKFRGSLTSQQATQAICKGLTNKTHKDLTTNYHPIMMPLADGGEGTLQIISNYIPGSWVSIQVHDPLHRTIDASYYIIQNCAYIQMAKASGLQLLHANQRNIMSTSTYGTGQLILHCINNKSINKVCLFIGGSATNDCGIGVAAALGYKFLNKNKQIVQPLSGNLYLIQDIRCPSQQINLRLKQVQFMVLTDVSNVLYGKNGAAQVYGPQKGANKQMVKQLDDGLKHISSIIESKLEVQVGWRVGGGAAGGLGAGAVAFLGATIYSGASKLMQLGNFHHKLAQCDLVITGEGKLDQQTLQGKLVMHVIQNCKKQSKPVWVVCGISELKQQQLINIYPSIKLITLVDQMTSIESSIQQASQLISNKINKVIENCYH